MLSQDETGRAAEERQKAAQPWLTRLISLRKERAAAIELFNALPEGEGRDAQGHRAVQLARMCLIARRDYREALAYGRPLTRRERREVIRRGG